MDRLRTLRHTAGLTQEQLAIRAGVSRQLVGAVEAGRHLPRVDAALALAGALGVDVAHLFGSEPAVIDVATGKVPADQSPVRVGWVGDRMVTAPIRLGSDGWDAADAVIEAGQAEMLGDLLPGVVMAGCEPALETLEHLLRRRGAGAVAVATSSAGALDALVAGRVHAAVVHGPPGELPPLADDTAVVRFGLTGWRVGLAVPVDAPPTWWAQVRSGELQVVQREPGAVVQRTFEAAVGRRVEGPRVGGHLKSARTGSASGLPAVTIEPAALAVGSRFHSLDHHVAEMWVEAGWIADRSVEALLDLVSSGSFRRRLELVGAYELGSLGTRVA
jgi:DNA-binding XRE family transcriptional regulator